MGLTNFPNGITSFGIPLGLASDTGNIIYLCAATTDPSYAFLQQRGISPNDVETSLTTACGKLRSGYNDTLVVMPGDHSTTVEVNITQNLVRIVGWSGQNMGYCASTSTTANTGVARLKTTTSGVARILHISGAYVTLQDIETFNSYDGTGNICDVYVAGRNFHAIRCAFRGGNGGTTQMGGNYGIPVLIGATYGARFDDCKIGSPGNYTRTSGPGFVMFEAGAGSGMVQFNDCIFCMRSETDGDNASGILIQETSIDRLLHFKNCMFYNFSVNWGAIPDHVINDDQTTTHDIVFQNCSMAGFDTMADTARAKTADGLPHTNGCESTAVATS